MQELNGSVQNKVVVLHSSNVNQERKLNDKYRLKHTEKKICSIYFTVFFLFIFKSTNNIEILPIPHMAPIATVFILPNQMSDGAFMWAIKSIYI